MKTALVENREKWNEMILILAGKFTMGTTEDEFIPEETPLHEVHLDAYYIDKYEVTNAQYWEFLQDIKNYRLTTASAFQENQKEKTIHRHTSHWLGLSCFDFPDYPVSRVDWFDAYAYAGWAGKRLPTEAEWGESCQRD